MLKRKYADRRHWNRIIDYDYNQKYLDTPDFSGYITLFTMKHVQEKLSFTYDEEEVCVVDNEYSWLQHFPDDEYYSITTSFNELGEPVQFYFDICENIGTEKGIPYLDDLLIDVVYLPSGKIVILDEDELEEALKNKTIHYELYQFAKKKTKEIIHNIKESNIPELHLIQTHQNLLKQGNNDESRTCKSQG